IRFFGRVIERAGDALEVRGDLDLAGVRRPLAVTATHADRRVRARVTLRPSDWGIRPYKALAGAIRLQDRVIVDSDLAAGWSADRFDAALDCLERARPSVSALHPGPARRDLPARAARRSARGVADDRPGGDHRLARGRAGPPRGSPGAGAVPGVP